MKRYFQRSAVFFSAMALLYHIKQFKKNAVFFSQTLDIISFLQVHISRGFIAILYNITIALPIIRIELTFLMVRVAKAFFGSCRLSSPDRYRHYLECGYFFLVTLAGFGCLGLVYLRLRLPYTASQRTFIVKITTVQNRVSIAVTPTETHARKNT